MLQQTTSKMTWDNKWDPDQKTRWGSTWGKDSRCIRYGKMHAADRSGCSTKKRIWRQMHNISNATIRVASTFPAWTKLWCPHPNGSWAVRWCNDRAMNPKLPHGNPQRIIHPPWPWGSVSLHKGIQCSPTSRGHSHPSHSQHPAWKQMLCKKIQIQVLHQPLRCIQSNHIRK